MLFYYVTKMFLHILLHLIMPGPSLESKGMHVIFQKRGKKGKKCKKKGKIVQNI